MSSTQPPPADVKTLFRAPFKTDKQYVQDSGRIYPLSHPIFVYDADGCMAASMRRINDRKPIPRGYGRHQYLYRGDERHDAWCEWFEINVSSASTLEDVAKVLNAAWSDDDDV